MEFISKIFCAGDEIAPIGKHNYNEGLNPQYYTFLRGMLTHVVPVEQGRHTPGYVAARHSGAGIASIRYTRRVTGIQYNL